MTEKKATDAPSPTPPRTGQDTLSAHKPQYDADGNCIDEHGRILPDWPAMRVAEAKAEAAKAMGNGGFSRRDL